MPMYSTSSDLSLSERGSCESRGSREVTSSLVRCGVCFKSCGPREARRLPCSHTFCPSCISQLISETTTTTTTTSTSRTSPSSSSSFPCPTCRSPTHRHNLLPQPLPPPRPSQGVDLSLSLLSLSAPPSPSPSPHHDFFDAEWSLDCDFDTSMPVAEATTAAAAAAAATTPSPAFSPPRETGRDSLTGSWGSGFSSGSSSFQSLLSSSSSVSFSSSSSSSMSDGNGRGRGGGGGGGGGEGGGGVGDSNRSIDSGTSLISRGSSTGQRGGWRGAGDTSHRSSSNDNNKNRNNNNNNDSNGYSMNIANSGRITHNYPPAATTKNRTSIPPPSPPSSPPPPPSSSSSSSSSAAMEKTCYWHPAEPLRFYCKQCREKVCRDCKLTTHEPHPAVGLREKSAQVRNAVSMVTSMVDSQLQPELVQRLQEAKSHRQRVKESARRAHEELQRRVSALHNMMDQALALTTQQLQQQAALADTAMTSALEGMQGDLVCLLSFKEHLNEVLNQGTSADIVDLIPELERFFPERSVPGSSGSRDLNGSDSFEILDSQDDNVLGSFRDDSWRMMGVRLSESPPPAPSSSPSSSPSQARTFLDRVCKTRKASPASGPQPPTSREDVAASLRLLLPQFLGHVVQQGEVGRSNHGGGGGRGRGGSGQSRKTKTSAQAQVVCDIMDTIGTILREEESW